jgi:hypothetical protein
MKWSLQFQGKRHSQISLRNIGAFLK